MDALVVGAGFGGLGAALTLVDAGKRVVLCETLSYPGGCASTFTRDGYRFEAGATMFSGFAPGQLMHGWIEHFALQVDVELLDPVVRFRAGADELVVPRDRAVFVDRVAALPGVPAAGARAFFAWQEEIADSLWRLFDDPALLPPWELGALRRHLRLAPGYAPLVGIAGRSLASVLPRFGVQHAAPLRAWLDAVCQITVQASAEEAEAPFALAAIDYFFRGCAHVRGGVGELAGAMCGAIEERGGEVRLTDRVKGLRREGEVWVATTRRGEVRARSVFTSTLPADTAALAGVGGRRIEGLGAQVARGWGAVAWYLVLAPDVALPAAPTHLLCVDDPSAPPREGNQILCSVSGANEARGPGGVRTATLSTHVPLGGDLARVASAAQARARRTLELRAPEVAAAIVHALPASPRTFERFTGRRAGAVGGIPRRVGVGQYSSMFPRPVAAGLWLVGDTVFPGQSTLATAIGGQRAAVASMR